ncbi:hypothetical protein Tco_0596311 [Tanacetum coccineum]
MTRFLASDRVGFGTNSLLEQWRDTYENADYDYDPYDDDMYEGQKIPDKIQSICDNLDIKVTAVFMDTSEWMGHNRSDKFLDQVDAIEVYCQKKLKSHPDNHVTIFYGMKETQQEAS